MPRTSRPTAYGPEYRVAIMEAFAETSDGRDWTLQLPDQNTANSLRAKFYAYFNAVRTNESHTDVARMVDALSLRVAGSALVFFRSSDSWDARALRDAMGLSKPPEAPVSNPHLEKLKQIRGAK